MDGSYPYVFIPMICQSYSYCVAIIEKKRVTILSPHQRHRPCCETCNSDDTELVHPHNCVNGANWKETWTPAWNGVRRGNDTRIHVAGSHLCFIRHLIAALLALAGITLKDWRWRVFQVRSFARKRRVCTERADSHA